jgi:hypothetical protein
LQVFLSHGYPYAKRLRERPNRELLLVGFRIGTGSFGFLVVPCFIAFQGHED